MTNEYLVGGKLTTAAALGILTAWWGKVWLMILFVIVFVLFDYFTGILAAGREHNINSSKATDGIYKKVGLLLLMVLGFGIDASLTLFASAGMQFNIPFNLPFGFIICAWIIINEIFSIAENLVRLDAPVPKWLIKFLKIAKDKLDPDETESGNG